jgi:hypothetical protein
MDIARPKLCGAGDCTCDLAPGRAEATRTAIVSGSLGSRSVRVSGPGLSHTELGMLTRPGCERARPGAGPDVVGRQPGVPRIRGLGRVQQIAGGGQEGTRTSGS